jgi:NCAIR mutase (PurE)-related protein
MEKGQIITLLKKVRAGAVSVPAALERLKHLPYEDLGFAKVDHHRPIRTGFPEVIFCQGKTEKQIMTIFKTLARENRSVLLTRLEKKVYAKIKALERRVKYHPVSKTAVLDRNRRITKKGLVLVLCAGTADIPVAEEAAVTAETFGCRVEKSYDVGVAGLHRLLDSLDVIGKSRCIIAVAGMEGALASIVGGMASCPVIAVPTSVGYGANFRGIAPLLTMLNTCAPGVSVVNINNGFGAGYLAALINRRSVAKT